MLKPMPVYAEASYGTFWFDELRAIKSTPMPEPHWPPLPLLL